MALGEGARRAGEAGESGGESGGHGHGQGRGRRGGGAAAQRWPAAPFQDAIFFSRSRGQGPGVQSRRPRRRASSPAPRRQGWGTCGQGPPEPRETLPGEPAGARSSTMSAARRRSLPLWRRQRTPAPACAPATCRRPRGRGRLCPFRSGRYPIHPLQRGGRCPRRGFESSDYLIAADTKPIFLLL